MFEHCSECWYLNTKDKNYNGSKYYCYGEGYVYPDSFCCDNFCPDFGRSYDESMRLEESCRGGFIKGLIEGITGSRTFNDKKNTEKANQVDINGSAEISLLNTSPYVHTILKYNNIIEIYPVYMALSRFRNEIVPSNNSQNYKFILSFDAMIAKELNKRIIADKNNIDVCCAILYFIKKDIYQNITGGHYESAAINWRILFSTLAEYYKISDLALELIEIQSMGSQNYFNKGNSYKRKK